LRTHEAVQSAIEAHRDYPDGIVVHGTPRTARAGGVVKPQICKTPAANMDGDPIDYRRLPPYVFATPPDPELADFPIFMATVKAFTLPYTAGVRVEGRSLTEGRLVFMADEDVKAAAKRRNHIGTMCILSAAGFGESPKGSWAEVVSKSEARIIGAYAVHYSALSFTIDSLPPLSIPGVSEEELRVLALAAREAAAPSTQIRHNSANFPYIARKLG